MDANGTVRYAGFETPCPTTARFFFERPEGYSHVPGQYLMLELSTREGVVRKPFSHCDAPGDPRVEILTRLTGSAFKDALLELSEGDEVGMSGPWGNLTLGPRTRRAAFLVGGVGVSPMRSIVRDAVQRRTGLTALVFDGNLDESCIPFKDEYDIMEEDPRIRFVHVLERPSAHWAGESGYITADVVRRHCDPLEGWDWLVAGPPAMVDAMKRVLDRLQVPAERASFELFVGY